jgi:hypothetical protein
VQVSEDNIAQDIYIILVAEFAKGGEDGGILRAI